ncbi:TonB-dependent receptor [Aureispira sp. CCB-E]|uniref:TonB-dependent receptor n=1 Tax=Aureispira sp. CCB-E TaxID=3051121 RepID=UPI0028697BC8|nr:TonB-dependent receptor [Aureispira sp. CCB-E]WMX12822.1 TonB-dependent receptor [Aureispira sp. CCB-E]
MKYFYIVIILLFSQFSFAWTELGGNIRGLVSNSESGQIIRGATIQLVSFKGKKTPVKAFSKDAGEFIFANVAPGLYNLECSAFGFKTTRIVGIQVREDQTKLAYFKLVRGPAAEINEIYTYAALEAKQKATTETGSTSNESIENTPATIYVVTSEDIEYAGYMGLNELLLDIPEIEIQNRFTSEDYNTISSRGIQGNEKLLLLVDGVRYNSMTSTKMAILENFNIRHVDRVEVILGPASALYGADAYMGVVNIITKRGRNAKGFNLTGSYGLYNTTSNAFQFGLGNDKMSFSMSGGMYYSEGVNLNEQYPDEFRWYNNNYMNNGTVLRSPFDPTGNTQQLPIKSFDLSRFSYFFDAKFRYKKLTIGFFHNQEQHSSSIGTKGQYSPYWKESRYGSSLSGININQLYQPKRSNKWSLNTLLNATFMFIPLNSKFVNTFSGYANAYKTGTDMGARLTETFNYTFNKTHKLAVGITLQHSMTLPKTSDIPQQPTQLFLPVRPVNTVHDNIYYLGTNHTDADGNSLKIYQDLYYLRRVIAAAFAEYRVNIKDKLLITLGARFDQIFDISEYSPAKTLRTYNSISPRLGLIYKPLSTLNFKLLIGRGYLQPLPQRKYDHFGIFYPVANASGEYTHIEGGFWRLPNENLRPETLNTIELSTKYVKGDLSIGVNGYLNVIGNAVKFKTEFDNQTFKGIPITAAERAINREELIYTYGGTLRADYRVVLGSKEQIKLKMHASYTFADGQIENLQYLPFSARHTLKAGVLFRLYNFSLNNSLIYRSESYNNGFIDNDGNFFQTGSPSFVVWNLFAKYKIITTKKVNLDVFVKINNVLNSKYYHATDNSAIGLGASPQDPIRFVSGLTVGFGG